MKTRILFSEDEEVFRETAAEVFRDNGYEVITAGTGTEAWKSLEEQIPDLVLTDIRMPGMDGLALLKRIQGYAPSLPVMMITAYGSVETAIEALRLGARDYICKPCNLEELLIRINRIAEEERTFRRLLALEKDSRDADFGSILGESPVIKKVFGLIERVAKTPSTVLITGPSGTGKELVARAIHKKSGRDRFVPVNCGAIPENLIESEFFGHRKGSFTGAIANKDGLFRIADKGTLFLDEIGELPHALQAKLLRALDVGEIQPVGADGPIKCEPRVVVATNRNLETEVKEGRFREDLFFRLNVIEINIPPLSERKEDIPVIAQSFVEKYARRSGKRITGIRPDVIRALQSAPWPGNVRELENVIERASILAESDRISLVDLPASFIDPETTPAESMELKAVIEKCERDHIRRVIDITGGDKQEAARLLGIGLSSLYRKIDCPGR